MFPDRTIAETFFGADARPHDRTVESGGFLFFCQNHFVGIICTNGERVVILVDGGVHLVVVGALEVHVLIHVLTRKRSSEVDRRKIFLERGEK